MELAILLGLGPEPLVNLARRQPMIEPDRVVVLGPSEEPIATPGSRPDPRKFAPSMRIVGLDELASDPGRHAREALDHLRSAANGYWLHLDLDVLSCSQLPAVDYPTEDGLSWQALEEIVHPALTDPGLIGASVVILNPVKDPDGRYAARVVKLLRHSIIRSNIPESA